MKTVRNVISFIMVFVLMLTLAATVFTSEFCTLTGNRSIYRDIACSEGITDRQKEIIDNKIDELAGKYHFDPEPVRMLITTEGLHTYAGQCIDWWMDALKGETGSGIPTWEYEKIMTTVREDPAFTAFISKYEQRSTARDKIAVPLANTVTDSVLCIRPELLGPLAEKASEKLDLNKAMQLLHSAPWIFGLLALLTAGLIELVSPGGHAQERIGYAFAACIPIIITFLTAFVSLDLTGMVAEASGILADQAQKFQNGIMFRMGCAILICVFAYAILSLKGKNRIAAFYKAHH